MGEQVELITKYANAYLTKGDELLFKRNINKVMKKFYGTYESKELTEIDMRNWNQLLEKSIYVVLSTTNLEKLELKKDLIHQKRIDRIPTIISEAYAADISY